MGKLLPLIPTLLGACGSAYADTATEETPTAAAPGGTESLMQEVVVTARKKEESLQSVPIAVSAFSAQKLEALDITESGDVARFTPNFNWNSEYGKTSPEIYLRGVGSNNFMPNNTGPIAVYQDNVYIGPNVAQAFGVFDLDRVEVLKGPQGTLYGRNSTGGLINFISRKPEIGQAGNGYVDVEMGEYGTVNTQAAIGLPLSDTLAFRLAFAENRNDGMWRNDNPDSGVSRSGNTNDVSVRAQLLYQPNPQLSVLFNLHDEISRTDVEPFKSIGFNCPVGVSPGFSLSTGSNCPDFFGFRDTANVNQTFAENSMEDLDARGGFVQTTYDFGPVKLTSLSAFDTADHRRFDDSDGTPEIELNVHFKDDFDYGSQELRLAGGSGRLDWTAGGYYYHEVYRGFTLLDSFDIDPTYGSGVDKKFATESHAVFGEANYRLTDQWRLSAGARWTSETKWVDRFNALTFNSTGLDHFIGSLADLTGINTATYTDIRTDKEKTFRKPTWRLSTDYTFTEGVMAYSSLSTGFKGGEINGLPGVSEPTKIIAPETLDAAEIGLKSAWFDRKVVLNLAYFYYWYKNEQVSTFSDLAGQTVAVLDNATNSIIHGIDADIEFAPTRNWYFSGALGLIDAHYGRYFSPEAGQLSGNRIAFVPEKKATLLARRQWALPNGGAIALQGDLIAVGNLYFQPTNAPYLRGPGYTVFNGALKYLSSDGRWTFSLLSKNLTNKAYLSSGFDVGPPLYPAQVKGGEPRYVGAKFDYNFGP
jgi:iron complex outermembrane recepter protein